MSQLTAKSQSNSQIPQKTTQASNDLFEITKSVLTLDQKNTERKNLIKKRDEIQQSLKPVQSQMNLNKTTYTPLDPANNIELKVQVAPLYYHRTKSLADTYSAIASVLGKEARDKIKQEIKKDKLKKPATMVNKIVPIKNSDQTKTKLRQKFDRRVKNEPNQQTQSKPNSPKRLKK
jgi:hypothetical protein